MEAAGDGVAKLEISKLEVIFICIVYSSVSLQLLSVPIP